MRLWFTMKKQRYQTAEISFDDFMAHPDAFGPSGKSVSEMAEETRAAEAGIRRQDRELKKALRSKKSSK